MKQNIPYPSLNTPAILLNLIQLETNVKDIQRAANEAGVKLRPHTKIHECVEIAKMQIAAGACGIEVGPIEQAEHMADGGIDDIVVAHPFYGEHKFDTLRRLLNEWPNLKLTIVVDMLEQAQGISQVGQATNRKVPVLLKIDTGVDRYGVMPGKPALQMAKKLKQLKGIDLVGIYAHESGKNLTKGIDEAALEVASMTTETAMILRKEGITLDIVAVGSSPTYYATCRLLKEGRFPEINEIHPGARVIGDIFYMMAGGNTRETCAVTVLTTIVSTSHHNYVVIDAGYKTFGCESMIAHRDTPGFFWNGRPSWGSIQGRTDLWFGRIGAECGLVYYKEGAKKDLKLGERLEIVPNNATMAINIHEKMYGVRNDQVEKVIPITGRGKGS